VAHWIDTARRTTGRSLVRGAAEVFLVFLALTACSGGSSGSTGAASTSTGSPAASGSSAASGSTSAGSGSATSQSITATEADFSITLDKRSIAAGTYDIQVVNGGHATHDLAVEQNGTKVAATQSIPPGGSASLTLTLQPGSYLFYCSIGNHRVMGMEVTVTVT
jgi:plastocyanin